MQHYIRLDLRVEVDESNLDDTDLDSLYEIKPKALLSASDNITLDGRQVVLDWDALDSDKPFAWAELLGWDIVEYDAENNW